MGSHRRPETEGEREWRERVHRAWFTGVLVGWASLVALWWLVVILR